jgi:hypothetical protein
MTVDPLNPGIDPLLNLVRAEAERDPLPIRIEQDNNEQPNSRQIAHPTRVDLQQQIDWNNQHGGKTPFQQRLALKSEPHTVFATSEAELQHNDPNNSQPIEPGRDGRLTRPGATGSDSAAGLGPFGIDGSFVESVVNPENDRLAAAHSQFHQRLAESKVVDRVSDVSDNYSHAARDLPEEYFPTEVVSGPTGVWDTSKLAHDRQVTATMVNPLDEIRKKV